MSDEASYQEPVRGLSPSIIQWVILGLLLLLSAIPIFSDGITAIRAVLTVLMVGMWALWVWLQPQGGQGLVIPLLAILVSFLLGGIVLLFTARDTVGIMLPFADRLIIVRDGLIALIDGAFLRPRAFSDTLVSATPLILTGLSVAVAFRAGLFNIGAEGQFLIGAVAAAFIGYAVNLPPVLHAIVCILAGAAGGALWGFIPGILKARLGAHEVINTIMMNFIAIFLTDWLVSGPMRDPGSSFARTPSIFPSAQLPQLGEVFPNVFGASDQLHIGFVLAILAAFGMWWLINKTTVGFELRTTGSNPDAAQYAGVRVERNVILAMTLAGALAGLAGAIEVQGLNRNLAQFFAAGYGFDAIAVALLAQNNPIGIIPAGIMFGALTTGSAILQIRTGVSADIVLIIQALILLFVAAPEVIRWLFRLRVEKSTLEEVPLTRGWGG
ncbi:MAG: ABC transporter permease [Chloroflexi bacterium]|nr:ABC transporter permease [Chloroflexota bacterium]